MKNKESFYIGKEYLLKKWDYNKNPNPDNFTKGSKYIANWKCLDCKSEFQREIIYMTRGNDNCPFCTGQSVNETNSLANNFPALLKDWDYNKNIIDPTKVTKNSGKEVWWKCHTCHSEYKTKICSRTLKNKISNCPYCLNIKTNHTNSIITTHPKLIEEWDYSKNIIKPEEIVFGTSKKVHWICKDCKFEQYLTPTDKLKTDKNKEIKSNSCKHTTVIKKKNILSDGDVPITISDLYFAKEWDYSKNNKDPSLITRNSHYKAHWICKDCKSNFQCLIYKYCLNNYRCPFCAGKQVNETNSVNKLYPEILKIWDPNNKLSINKLSAGTNIIGNFICNKCYSSYSNSINQIVTSLKIGFNGCPFCSGRKVNETNNLSITHPELIKEWNYDKNNKNPEEYTRGSNFSVWWKCSENHEWKAVINNRSNGILNCPECTNGNASIKETAWLDFLNIPKEYRQVKITINTSWFFVDGIDPKTGDILEFNGDFYHGNPSIYNSNDYNVVCHKTFGELYQKTLEKEKALKDAGYKVISIWENEWDKINKEIINQRKNKNKMQINQIYCGDAQDLLLKLDIKPDLFIMSPPDQAETSMTLPEYRNFLKSIYQSAADKLKEGGVLVSITTDRKLNGGIYLKHTDIINAIAPQLKLFNYKIWAKSLKTNLYILNFCHMIFFCKGERPSIKNHLPEFLPDVWLLELDKVKGYKNKDSFPSELVKRLILTFTNTNDLILDPFIGSGKTAKIAQDLNRNFIGFELNPDFVNLANKLLVDPSKDASVDL